MKVLFVEFIVSLYVVPFLAIGLAHLKDRSTNR